MLSLLGFIQCLIHDFLLIFTSVCSIMIYSLIITVLFTKEWTLLMVFNFTVKLIDYLAYTALQTNNYFKKNIFIGCFFHDQFTSYCESPSDSQPCKF